MLRFAPSPTSDMHIQTLRVAILNYIVAKQRDDRFIVRIEDRDKEKNIEGKDTEILEILEKFALPHDGVSHESENLHIHQTLAIRLLQEEKAFICTCTVAEIEAKSVRSTEKKSTYCYSGHCHEKQIDALESLKEQKIPFVLRLKKPESPIINHDLIQGDIKTTPDEIDSFIILRSDSTPTYNFSCACDDMLSDVDLIIRSEAYLHDTPKQIHIKQLLGYGTETLYAHLPAILHTKREEIPQRDANSSLEWLLSEGYIPDAIINYLLLIGNKAPQEIFTLPEALEWFDLQNISKDPREFDIKKLQLLNREHLKMMDDKRVSTLFGFADEQIGKLAKVYLQEVSTINALEIKIKSIFAPKSFDGAWGKQMRTLEEIINQADYIEEFKDFENLLMKESGLTGQNFSEPLRILLTGANHGPELSDIYPHIKSYILEIAS